jgi:thiamine biosynthesis lipoprotein
MIRGRGRRAGLLTGLLAALCLATLIGVGRRPHLEVRETIYVFGTLVELVVRDAEEETAREALADVAGLLQDLHSEWHAWRPGALTTLNQAIARGEGADVPHRLAEQLVRARNLACASGSRFEPAIGRAIGLWGFHQDVSPTGAPPSAAEIAAVREAHPRLSDLIIDGTHVSSTNPAVEIDLGGFAKGAALALAAEHLKARGIENAVLNAGGDVTVMGDHGARPWRVAIRDPFVWGAIASVELKGGESLYTSGNYERYFEFDGTRFAHIIDPETAMPVQTVVSVTVLHKDAALADAAATALSVAGREDWPQVAADMGVDAVLLIDDTGAMFASPAMAARLAPVGETVPHPLPIDHLPAARAPTCAPSGMALAVRQGRTGGSMGPFHN